MKYENVARLISEVLPENTNSEVAALVLDDYLRTSEGIQNHHIVWTKNGKEWKCYNMVGVKDVSLMHYSNQYVGSSNEISGIAYKILNPFGGSVPEKASVVMRNYLLKKEGIMKEYKRVSRRVRKKVKRITKLSFKKYKKDYSNIIEAMPLMIEEMCKMPKGDYLTFKPGSNDLVSVLANEILNNKLISIKKDVIDAEIKK